jgi:hypothetical protein
VKVKVDLFAEGLLIGSAELDKLDPPMGCALGDFSPSEHYDPLQHAIFRDGEHAASEDLVPISVALTDGRQIVCLGVTIFDGRPYLDELEADVIGMELDAYRDLFSAHPHYISHYEN